MDETEGKAGEKEADDAGAGVGVSCVNPDQALILWPHVARFFASFEERSEGEVKASELFAMVLKRERQMWVAVVGKEIKACGLTEVLPKTVVFDFCAGVDRHEWRDAFVKEVCLWAKHIKRSRVRIICRPGWAREIKGFRETHRVLERDLDGQE